MKERHLKEFEEQDYCCEQINSGIMSFCGAKRLGNMVQIHLGLLTDLCFSMVDANTAKACSHQEQSITIKISNI